MGGRFTERLSNEGSQIVVRALRRRGMNTSDSHGRVAAEDRVRELGKEPLAEVHGPGFG